MYNRRSGVMPLRRRRAGVHVVLPSGCIALDSPLLWHHNCLCPARTEIGKNQEAVYF